MTIIDVCMAKETTHDGKFMKPEASGGGAVSLSEQRPIISPILSRRS